MDDHRDQALRRVLTLLEDSEPWARNFLRTPPPRLVDLDRMAASIVDSLEVIRGTKARLSPDGPEKT